MSIIQSVANKQRYALVAQLDRVLDYESRGQGFESLRARQKRNTLCLPTKGVSFQLNPPLAEEIHLRWMKSLRDEILLRKVKGGGFNFI